MCEGNLIGVIPTAQDDECKTLTQRTQREQRKKKKIHLKESIADQNFVIPTPGGSGRVEGPCVCIFT